MGGLKKSYSVRSREAHAKYNQSVVCEFVYISEVGTIHVATIFISVYVGERFFTFLESYLTNLCGNRINGIVICTDNTIYG